MIDVLHEVMEKSLARLSQQLITYLPPLIVACVIVVTAFLLALGLRWLILKAVKGIALDKFLQDSGLVSVIDRSGRLRAVSLVAGAVFWLVLGIGFLSALDVFDTTITSRAIEATILAIPKLLTAALILLAGFWLSQYLSRSTLVWAVNDGIPFARRLAAVVKLVVLFVAVVVAAETLDFATRVFFAAFVIFAGAVALAAAIAAGLALRSSLDRALQRQSEEPAEERERSLWSHL